VAQRERKRSESSPSSYYLDESDPDILMLCRQNESFVAAFSARGATREGIVEAAKEDYYGTLRAQTPAGD
jgi:hypothetical protein